MSRHQLALPKEESLPFIVRAAITPQELSSLCALRSQAYDRHDYTATLASRLAVIDEDDARSILLTAIDKRTGECIGTQRVSLSTLGPCPIVPEEDVTEIGGDDWAYVDRFAVANDKGHRIVRLALMKAMWLLVCDRDMTWVAASAMRPLARLYGMVGMRALKGAEDGFQHPKLHDTARYYMVGGRVVELLHNTLAKHPELASWFVDVHHPDIEFQWPPRFLVSSKPPTVDDLETGALAET